MSRPAQLLRAAYEAAVDGAQPTALVEAAVRAWPVLAGRPTVWLIAFGKAATAMASGAVAGLRAHGLEPAGGAVVDVSPRAAPHRSLHVLLGDHPVPGARSAAAAEELGRVSARVRDGHAVLVLVSGGGSSLVAAPVAGVSQDDLTALATLLGTSGLDIHAMNAVRKRVARWGAGRLAVALAPAEILYLVMSDVPGNDVGSIASGPCVPDPLGVRDVRAVLERAELGALLPATVESYLRAVEHGAAPETPKPGDAAFSRVTTIVVGSNELAADAAARHALHAGCARAEVVDTALRGDARRCAETVAARGRAEHDALAPGERRCLIWSGEPTVTLDRLEPGALGGRCQELALACACALDGTREITVLAAGTDGRDGPTDAAGAVVDGTTWRAVSAAGRDPARDLAAHDAYHALDAVGALLRRGPTGTNVMDLVLVLVERVNSPKAV